MVRLRFAFFGMVASIALWTTLVAFCSGTDCLCIDYVVVRAYRTVVRYMELRALRSIAFGALLICLTYLGVMLGPASDLPDSV